MVEYLCRICWNSNDWEAPSGNGAALEGKDTYLGKFGFGHEEWLFDSVGLVDGWKYGYLSALTKLNAADKKKMKSEGASIRLFTRMNDNVSRMFYYIQDAFTPSSEEANAAATLNQEAVFQSRSEDLRRVLPPEKLEAALQKLKSEKGDPQMINIKFRPDRIIPFNPPIELNIVKNPRYHTRLWDPEEFLNDPGAQDLVLQPPGVGTLADEIGQETISVLRRGVSETLVDLAHQRIQILMRGWLRTTYLDHEVSETEVDHVDITLWTSREKILIEIKTAGKAKECIREALGQLLEYNHHGGPGQFKAHELVIVGPEYSTQADKDYIHDLRQKYRLPIAYAKYDSTNGAVLGWTPGSAIIKRHY